MTAGVKGVDVVISVEGTALAGQRGARLSGGQADMIDMSVRTDYPNRVSEPGWNTPEIIECDCLLLQGGDGGFAYWKNLEATRTLVDVVVTLDSGDEGTGQAWVIAPEFDAQQDKEGTMSLRLQVNGKLTWVPGA